MSGLPSRILFTLVASGIGYFAIVNAVYAVLLVAATVEGARRGPVARALNARRVLASVVAPRISVVAPAYNEEVTVSVSVRALLTLAYSNLEVVVVDDGSTDGTLAVLQATFELAPVHAIYRRQIGTAAVHGLYRSNRHPELVVVAKANGGKADALNAGLNVATGDLVCAVDADTIVEPDALARMVMPFLESDRVVAAGGTIRVANGSIVRHGRVVEPRVPRRPLPGMQAVEYLRAFLFGRLGWNRLGGNLVVSGAFGLFRRAALLDAGGYHCDTVGEDMEIVARLRRRGIERRGAADVRFLPDPVAWTEAPSSLAVLGHQRDRWQRGLAEVLWRHRGVLGRPRYRALGLVVMPYFLLIELLAPVVELLALVALLPAIAFGATDLTFVLLFVAVAYGLGVVLTTASIAVEQLTLSDGRGPRELTWLLLWALLEPLGYRQFTGAWRLRGLWRWLRGGSGWGHMTRTGFGEPIPDG